VGVRRETGIGREAHPRFAADCMLGGLARHLRALGCDVAWRARVADRTLVRDALAQRRVVLTRDAGLMDEWMLDNLLLIHADDPLAQVREVAAAYPLNDAGLFTRCTRCNEPLAAAPPDVIEARVPPAVRAAQHDFRQCPCCERVYWEGTHTARMRRELRSAIGRPGG
jgi:uncharacterized protein with PIN domain